MAAASRVRGRHRWWCMLGEHHERSKNKQAINNYMDGSGAAATLIAMALTRFNLSAWQELGPVETAIGNRAKRFYIRRASRHGIPPRPADLKTSIEDGATYYGLECTICHADDGRGQRELGQWEYPRAADLTSRRVQSYSDEELFWIIQNGIRYTGMPSFAKVETPDHIWDLVNYVRTLPGDLRTQDSRK